ncbi:MAG TPA: HAMP domain-containing histidine kinase [Desulfuromonadales bacterium]|nr:HAMP domain-containing histidine kinase [Desulfuromonadales bacterium]
MNLHGSQHNDRALNDDVLNGKVALDQLALYCQTSLPTLPSAAVISVAMTYFFWGHVSSSALLAWLIYQLMAGYFRLVTIKAFQKSASGQSDVAAWRTRFQLGTFLVGSGWGVGNVILYQNMGVEYDILVNCTFAGLMGIAASTMSIMPRVFPAFIFPIMAPYLLVHVASGTTFGYGQALFGVLYIVILQVTSQRNNDVMMTALRLSHQNQLLKEQADAASQVKGEFLSSVSHELRTPMTSVYGFAKVIKKKMARDVVPHLNTGDERLMYTVGQIQSNLDVIVSEGERLTSLINNVLDLAKLDAGRVEWHFSEIDLAAIIEHVAATIKPLTDARNLFLKLDVASDVPAIKGDRDRLVQVLINLASNAVKFSELGGITISVRCTHDEILVSVTDTGIGIAPENCAKVFDKFHQIGDTLTDKPKGTGLGLSICKEIVERHGGRIWVKSEMGVGSSFCFTVLQAPETDIDDEQVPQ